jgi:hypothetical protein
VARASRQCSAATPCTQDRGKGVWRKGCAVPFWVRRQSCFGGECPFGGAVDAKTSRSQAACVRCLRACGGWLLENPDGTELRRPVMGKRRRDAGKEPLWRRRLRAQRSSKLSVRDSCQRQRRSIPSCYVWLQRWAERVADCAASVKQARPRGRERRRPLAFVRLTACASPACTSHADRMTLAAGFWTGGLPLALELGRPPWERAADRDRL